MQIPRSFKEDLDKAYAGELTLDEFLVRSSAYFRRLAKYALRYPTAWLLSDEDDLVQEASLACIRALWQWDDERGVSLARYVLYQIGSHLQGLVLKEKRKRRHPDPNKSWRCEIREGVFGSSDYLFEQVVIREAWNRLTDDEKNLIARSAGDDYQRASRSKKSLAIKNLLHGV